MEQLKARGGSFVNEKTLIGFENRDVVFIDLNYSKGILIELMGKKP